MVGEVGVVEPVVATGKYRAGIAPVVFRLTVGAVVSIAAAGFSGILALNFDKISPRVISGSAAKNSVHSSFKPVAYVLEHFGHFAFVIETHDGEEFGAAGVGDWR